MKLRRIIVLVAYLLTATAEANSSSVKGLWTTYQGNSGHTGYVDVKVDPAKFKVLWTKKLSDPKHSYENYISQPAITDHAVYFTASNSENRFQTNQLIALNPKTGETLWKVPLNNSKYLSAPAYDNGKIYIVEIQQDERDQKKAAFIEAYDAETGALQFSTNVPCTSYSSYYNYQTPVIADHHLYAGTDDSQFSINTNNGRIDWITSIKANLHDGVLSDQYLMRVTRSSLDMFNRQTGVMESSINGGFYFTPWDLSDAVPVWDGRSRTAYGVFSPQSENCGTDGHCWGNVAHLIAFDVEQKRVKWDFKLGDMSHISQPVIADNMIYFGATDLSAFMFGGFYALEASSGKKAWYWFSTDSIRNMIVTPDVIFASGQYNTFVISRTTHQQISEFPEGGSIAVGDNMLYITSNHTLDQKPHTEITAIALN